MMTHRQQAEEAMKLSKCGFSSQRAEVWATLAQTHALLAIHDLLEQRLRRTV